MQVLFWCQTATYIAPSPHLKISHLTKTYNRQSSGLLGPLKRSLNYVRTTFRQHIILFFCHAIHFCFSIFFCFATYSCFVVHTSYYYNHYWYRMIDTTNICRYLLSFISFGDRKLFEPEEPFSGPLYRPHGRFPRPYPTTSPTRFWSDLFMWPPNSRTYIPGSLKTVVAVFAQALFRILSLVIFGAYHSARLRWK